MTVTMSLDILIWMTMISNFFKVMNASGGVIGPWAFERILDALGRWLRIFEGPNAYSTATHEVLGHV